MIQETSSYQKRKFYRSVPYRSVSIDINPQKLSTNRQKLPSFQYTKPQTAKNEYRESKKIPFPSQQKMKNFNKALSQSLSKAKQVNLNSTMISIKNPQIETMTNFGTCSYLESFQQLMQTQKKRSYEPKKLGPIALKLESKKLLSIPDRITLPNIIQYQNSQFTALDPIYLPINGIKQQIQKTKRSIEKCPNQLQSIRWEMKDFKQKSMIQAMKFQQEFKKGIDRLWALLRENTVHQQAFSLRTKREIKEIQDFLPQFKRQFQKTHQNQLSLQTTIFQTSPFQLKRCQDQQLESTLKSSSLLKIQNDYF